MSSYARGQAAEDTAAQYLANKQYRIIDRNWRTKWCEIDIVARKDDCVYFVEVKYRKTAFSGNGLDYITQTKLIQMSRAAESWVQANDGRRQYDLAVIALTGNPPVVTRALFTL